MKQKADWKIICTGILCLTGLEIFALSKGINGVLLTTIISVIAVAIGVTIPNPLIKKE